MGSIRFGILTISDRSYRGDRPDASGPVLEEAVVSSGWEVRKRAIVSDDQVEIQQVLIAWADSAEIDIILTTGGTGFSPRDVTPEATLAAIERLAPGIAETMRASSLKVTPHAMLSRATAGIRKHTLIVNLPGSPRAALENLESISGVLPHAVELLSSDPFAEAGHTFSPPAN